MINKIVSVVAIFILFIANVFSASFNVNQQNYMYVNQNQKWEINGNGAALTRDILKQHLQNSDVNCLKELGRLMLAQSQETEENYNVAENNNADYIIKNFYMNNYFSPRPVDDISSALVDVKNHLLEQGHLGYYPLFYNGKNKSDPAYRISTANKRSMFNIDGTIGKRIFQKHVIGLLSALIDNPAEVHLNLNNITAPHNYSTIDPVGNYINLETATDNILKAIFSTTLNIQPQINDHNPNTFNIKVNIHREIAGSIRGIKIHGALGKTINNQDTNEVLIGVSVRDGKIRISTIFPD